MIQLKQVTPIKFLGKIRNDLVIIYAEDENGIRYNIKAKDNEDNSTCAAVLCELPITTEYEITNEKTLNPSEIN